MHGTEDLRRELGVWDALTIGVGTMIGAGIFLLAGVALELTGPAAALSYVTAGFICVLTAASAAELATGMPTSGGAYYFISRAFGPWAGSVAGIGTWLSLTVAISFYLYGLGEYFAYFLPLTPFWGAVAGGLILTALNVWGAKESGRTQVGIVMVLVGILAVFVIGGLFHLEPRHLHPFMPFGTEPIFGTTALVFVSFLGFVKIAAVAEEVREPAKNLPRALIGSVVVVTFLYLLIVLIIGGVFPQETIGEVRDPLTAAARLFFGGAGAVAIIVAGLLATASSANASIMASSRVNLAMARDRLVPYWLSAIHARLLTPHRAILLTAGSAGLFLFVRSLEDLAKIASSLQLLIYAALNLAVIALRGADPEWYRPDFRTPGYPLTQLVGAAGCLVIIAYSGPYAKLAVGGLVVISLVWYLVWGRSRVRIEHGVAALRARWSALGARALFPPPHPPEPEMVPAVRRKEPRMTETRTPRQLTVGLAAPEHEADLIQLARYVATGQNEGGRVTGIHLQPVPLHTPLDVARERHPERTFLEATILQEAEAMEQVDVGERPPLAMTWTQVKSDFAHDVADALVVETERHDSDMLLIGWQGRFDLGQLLEHPVQRVMANVKADLAVFKDRGLLEPERILVPWGGGVHARLGLEVALRIGRATGADVDVLRVVKPQVDPEEESRSVLAVIDEVIEGDIDVGLHVRRNDSVVDGIVDEVHEHGHHLAVVGASRESRLRQVFFGSIPDKLADALPCSVLMVRRHLPERWTVRFGESVRSLRERAGLSSSPAR
jgi:amino acid transporter/nucleotide-binding universal stress UspA family protein